jgi:hypothetical protein
MVLLSIRRFLQRLVLLFSHWIDIVSDSGLRASPIFLNNARKTG